MFSELAGGSEPAITETRRVYGVLQLPPKPAGLLVLAHGTEGRYGARNRSIAQFLAREKLGTAMLGELDDETAGDALARLTAELARWALHQPGLGELPFAYLGFGTSAHAALAGCALGPRAPVAAIGGRPGRAAEVLARVTMPALLIAGRGDLQGCASGLAALEVLPRGSELYLVDGARDGNEILTLLEGIPLAHAWLIARLRL